MKLLNRCVLACALLVPVAAVSAQDTLDLPTGHMEDFREDSGLLSNKSDNFQVVYQKPIRVQDIGSIRLFFSEDTALEGASYLRVSSLLDGEVQELSFGHLVMWNHATAYFNGDTVLLELVAAPHTTNNRVELESVLVETFDEAFQRGAGGQCGICGGSDDRVPSSEEWTGRLLPAGCTATIYNVNSCLVSAGHCVDGTGSDVIQFNVPNSTGGCALQHPPVADQFPIDMKQFVNAGIGADWAVMTTGMNNLNETIYERFGVLRTIDMTPPSVGQACQMYGYGADLTCVRNQTQQFAQGNVSQVTGTLFTYTIDLRGGNSGSAMIRNDQIFGIATHCPCPNVATRIDLAAFVNARENMCPDTLGACCTESGVCVDVFTIPECDDLNGTLQGVGTICADVTCTPTFGACCFDDTCADTTPSFCEDTLGGTWQGPGTSCGDVDPCAPQPGACCLPDGTCNDILEDDCNAAGGTWQGVSETCATFTCPPVFAACCFDDTCADTTQDFCVNDLGGEWMFPATCAGDPCTKKAPCPGDTDNSGDVGVPDLLNLLGAWGPCGGCPEDFDDSGSVGTPDLLILLGAWGPCP